jgi:hypothetical protein
VVPRDIAVHIGRRQAGCVILVTMTIPRREYGPDVLAGGATRRTSVRTVTAELELVVEEVETGFCGAVVEMERAALTLEDRHGRRRLFPWAAAGFLLDGETVTLSRPVLASPVASSRTASGSVAVHGQRARVARAGRILVEGRHDSELVEAIWGDDLRIEGVVVEQLQGADNLLEVVRSFSPGDDARLGVLLDHLVPGSKESRIAESVRSAHVLVVGHPFVDIWQAVKPDRLGMARWPDIPKGLSWKDAMAAHLGAPDVASAWLRVRKAARSWIDLEPALLGPVEALIDFVTAPASTSQDT